MAENPLLDLAAQCEKASGPSREAELVERLRVIDEEAMYHAPATTHATINEAADTITRLLREREEMREALGRTEAELDELYRSNAYGDGAI